MISDIPSDEGAFRRHCASALTDQNSARRRPFDSLLLHLWLVWRAATGRSFGNCSRHRPGIGRLCGCACEGHVGFPFGILWRRMRGRLERAGVPAQRYRLYTIDGWSIRLISTFPARGGHNPAILRLENARGDYPAIRDAAWRLLQAGHVNEVIRASYAQLIVDEYQDCSVPQHQIVCWLSTVLPTCVLGDPLQAIFGFQGNALADWTTAVCTYFPVVAELQTPWRWRNANAEALGQWLLHARRDLIAGRSVDVRTGPDQVTWVQLSGPEDHVQRLAAARTAAPAPDGDRSGCARRAFTARSPGSPALPRGGRCAAAGCCCPPRCSQSRADA
jgi:hypothetical protein